MGSPLAEQPRLSRRDLINGLVAGAVVLVAGRLAPTQIFAQTAAGGTPLNAWVAIAPDGTVTLQCAHSEMGQGIMTTFAAVIADELEADWQKCEVVFAPAAPPYRHPVYNWQFTGNAESIRSYHALIRKMGAAAREMLIAAAADRLNVPATDLDAREGSVRHGASGRALGYGKLAAAAAAKPVPAEPRVKPESEWRLVGGGRSLPRRDVPAKVEGRAVFGMDVTVPGMATRRSPARRRLPAKSQTSIRLPLRGCPACSRPYRSTTPSPWSPSTIGRRASRSRN